MFDAEEIRLEIIDNGKGFDVPKNWVELVRRGHYGLASAAERVSALGGIFKVESHPQEKTQVQVVIPCKEILDQADNDHL
jgi:signal transduction histidine kinase